MTKVLITGATGNVGTELIKSLQNIDHQLDIYAGVRNSNEDRIKLSGYKVNFSLFDFTDLKTYKTGLDGCEILFLLRPPKISEVEKYFKPIIDTCKENGVIDSQIPYTFLRPAYFMQNLTTILHNDLVNKKRIYLPAGNAKFTLVDVRGGLLLGRQLFDKYKSYLNPKNWLNRLKKNGT